MIFFFFKHLRMLCFYMLENTNHKSCWISATAVWSLETAFLSMGGRDRQKSRGRQAAAPGHEACSYRKLEWKEMMTSRAQCLCHEGAKALALWSLCMRSHDQWQGLNFPPFLELKYKSFLVIFKLLPVESIAVFHGTHKTQQDNKDLICRREGNKQQVLSRG